MFIDESHNGGTTDISKDILKVYGKDATIIHTTATYLKPNMIFGIPNEN